MSSSADALGWNAFSERPVGAAGALASPASEMAAVLQRYRSDLDAAQAEVEAACRRGLEALAQQAVLAVRLEAALALYEPQLAGASMEKAHQHLRILKDQMLAELAAAGVEPVRLEGRSYDEIAELVEVDGWLHRDDIEAEVVLEELEPAVRGGDEVIRIGRVVMGAPAEKHPAETASEGRVAPEKGRT